MYEAHNHKELKKLLQEGKTPIIVRDRDTIEVVETLESLKNQGVASTIKQKILGMFVENTISYAISETTVVALGIISAVALVSLYGIYKGKRIRIKYNPDGTLTIEIY